MQKHQCQLSLLSSSGRVGVDVGKSDAYVGVAEAGDAIAVRDGDSRNPANAVTLLGPDKTPGLDEIHNSQAAGAVTVAGLVEIVPCERVVGRRTRYRNALAERHSDGRTSGSPSFVMTLQAAAWRAASTAPVSSTSRCARPSVSALPVARSETRPAGWRGSCSCLSAGTARRAVAVLSTGEVEPAARLLRIRRLSAPRPHEPARALDTDASLPSPAGVRA